MRSRTGTGEPEVVRAEDLARVLRSAQYRYDAVHPEQTTNWDRTKHKRRSQMSFQAYLTHRCRIMDPDGIGINARRIYMLIRGTEQKYVGLWTADLVLTALGLNGCLYTDEIPVMKNPRWRQDSYDRYMEAAGVTMLMPSPQGKVSD